MDPFARNAWYVAAWSRELRSRPLRRTLLGTPVVLFRKASGDACAIHARCPHRGEDLSRGRVVSDTLECPFHGWRWDGQGVCRLIPSQGAEGRIPSNARVPHFHVREEEGHIWIWMGEDIPTDLPGRDTRQGLRARTNVLARPGLLRAPFWAMVENALDDTHPPFVHLRTFGKNEPVALPDLKIEERGDGRGFRSQRVSEGAKTVSPGSSWLARQVFPRDTSSGFSGFELGGLVYFSMRDSQNKGQVHWLNVTPSTSETTWIFYSVFSSDASWRHRLALRWYLEWTNREDSRLLENLIPAASHREVSCPADRPTLLIRRTYAQAARKEAKRDDERVEHLEFD